MGRDPARLRRRGRLRAMARETREESKCMARTGRGRLAALRAVALGVCLLAGLTGATAPRSPGLAGDVLWKAELATYDARLRMRAGRGPSRRVVIVGVDNDSLMRVGQWPWPRSYHAALVDVLRRAGAKIVGFDMVFDLPSGAQGPTKEDRDFAAAIKRAGNVVLACEVIGEQQRRGPVRVDATRVLMPHELFARGAAGVGAAAIPEDEDGVVRRVKLIYRLPGVEEAEGMPFLAAVIAALADGQRVDNYIAAWAQASYCRHPWLGAGAEEGDGADFLIDYRDSPPAAFEYVPYHAVLEGTEALEQFRGKIVLVGMASGFEPDLKLHPMGSQVSQSEPLWWMKSKMPGVEVVANVVDMLLDGRMVVPAPPWAIWTLPVVWAALVWFLVDTLRLRAGLFAALAAIGAHWAASCYEMVVGGVWIPVISVGLAVGLAYLVAATSLWFLEERRAQWLTKAWGTRVSPEILSVILADPNLQHIPGRRQTVSVMFIDLAGSTELSAQVPPEVMISCLNEYLSLATEVIRKHGGTVHKFIGDGVMAVFGDPIELPDHAQRAVDAAFEFQTRMDGLRKSLQEQGKPVLYARVGIHSGEVVAGDVGWHGMLEYTVIGQTVNTAARMETLNKELGSSICVSADTYRQLGSTHLLRPAGAHEVSGLPNPVEVYADLPN